jgi:hypothetical protein
MPLSGVGTAQPRRDRGGDASACCSGRGIGAAAARGSPGAPRRARSACRDGSRPPSRSGGWCGAWSRLLWERSGEERGIGSTGGGHCWSCLVRARGASRARAAPICTRAGSMRPRATSRCELLAAPRPGPRAAGARLQPQLSAALGPAGQQQQRLLLPLSAWFQPARSVPVQGLRRRGKPSSPRAPHSPQQEVSAHAQGAQLIGVSSA